jgi:hypothetical protein
MVQCIRATHLIPVADPYTVNAAEHREYLLTPRVEKATLAIKDKYARLRIPAHDVDAIL